MTCTYGFSHFRHFQNCCNRDGNTIFKYMNYVPIVVATDLEVHFSVLKKGCPNTLVYIVYVQVIGVWWWVLNEWMNEWCIYIALLLCIAIHPSALQSCGGSLLNHHQCAASTWMMRRQPQDNVWLKVYIYSHTRGVKLGLGLGFMQTSQVLPHWLNQSFSSWTLSYTQRHCHVRIEKSPVQTLL